MPGRLLRRPRISLADSLAKCHSAGMPTILIIGASHGLGLESTRQYTAGGDRRLENDSTLRSKFMTPGAAKSLTRSAGRPDGHTERHTRRRRVGADDSDRRAALRYCDPLRRCRRCVVRRGHPLATSRDTGWESLADYPLVLPPASTYTRVAIDSFMAEHHVAFPRRHL